MKYDIAIDGEQRRSRRYLLQVWALCTPGLITLFVAVPIANLELSAAGRRPVGPTLEEISGAAILVTALGGLFLNGAAVVSLVRLSRLKIAAKGKKWGAAAAVALSLAGFVWAWAIVSHMWGS